MRHAKVDPDASAVELEPVEVLDALLGVLGRGHRDEPKPSRSVRCQMQPDKSAKAKQDREKAVERGEKGRDAHRAS